MLKDAGKITLIILDRSIDPISPVIHDFYYESMLYDILNV
jgi:syntaxin-binding protein 1